MKALGGLVCAGILAGCASAAVAATIQVQSDLRDYEAIKTVSGGALSTSNGVGGDNRIGSRTTTTLSSSVLAFALPAGPAANITAATLSVVFEGESTSLKIEAGDGNVDLYGLPFATAANFAQDANRYFSGPTDAASGVTKLQDNLFTPAEYPAEGATTTKVSVDISTWLKSLYTAGAVAGDFAILRLSYDVDALSGNNRYRVVTSGGDGSTVDATPHTIADGAPFLSITTVPEPSSFVGLSIALAGLAARRRR